MLSTILAGIGRITPLIIILIGSSGCASSRPALGSAESEEVYIAPRPHILSLDVRILEDTRPQYEQIWGHREGYQNDLPRLVTDRVAQQLGISRVFLSVKTVSGSPKPDGQDSNTTILNREEDLLLVGELAHFFAQVGSDGKINGRVELGGLKLYSTHTGRLLWEGISNKEIARQERRPLRESDYAGEALRGAINILAIQLAGFSFSREQVFENEEVPMRMWRVGILPLTDLRTNDQSQPEVQNLNKNISDSSYADDKSYVSVLCGIFKTCSRSGSIATSRIDSVQLDWYLKLTDSNCCGRMIRIPAPDQNGEAELNNWYNEGVDAILMGNLANSFGSIEPPRNQLPFPIWSGGMGFHRTFKTTALTQIQEVRLIRCRDGSLIWKGDAEYGIDRMEHSWTSPGAIALESVEGALGRLERELSGVFSLPDSTAPPS